MKFIAIAILSLALAACGGPRDDRQATADHIFGAAKMGLVVASGLVSVYNLLPVCGPDSAQPPLCYSEGVGTAVNKGLEAASVAIESSERIFAAANTEGDKLNAANAAKAAVAELVAALGRYGVTRRAPA